MALYISKTQGNMSAYLLRFQDIHSSELMLVGGKGANLAELSRISGVVVPEGFCITANAYREVVGNNREVNNLLNELAELTAGERERISVISAKIRTVIEQIPIPAHIAETIVAYLDERKAFAVRSSATAEDLPAASFAGQQDSYLNIIGAAAILKHISRCWASLFTDRAVIYRIRNGFGHRNVQLSVVVQQMVFPQVAGIMFTADPVTGNRKVVSIDAGFGLGEALVAGLVNADVYKTENGKIIDKRIAAKKLAIYAVKDGGTRQEEIEPTQQYTPALTDEQVLQLERLGRKIEAHFGRPQDIEWCLVNDTFYIVQSRPVTTLFPIPEAHDGENRVYVSVAHQQMMTDVIKPLGLSFYLLYTRASMYTAGGRLFVDITPHLASPGGKVVIDALSKSDPLIKDALATIGAREGFIRPLADAPEVPPYFGTQPSIDGDPAIVAGLIRMNEASVKALKQNIPEKSGPALFEFILHNISELKKISANPQHMVVIMAAMNALFWINEKMNEWLGEKNVADTLAQSVPNNVTSEMGLALLDVADVIRPYPQLVAYLQRVKDDSFLDELLQFDGGKKAHRIISDFLDKYGMRCAGEIDITRPRWAEQPTMLVPVILTNIRNFEPGASQRRFEQGRQEALAMERLLLERLRQLPDGEQKALETKQKIGLVRHFSGYREYPKYGIVSHYFVYKQALLKEAERLVKANVIREKEDIFYLSFEELLEVVRTNNLDNETISKRKEEYRSYEKLTPPRVITSNGEIITGKYNREDLPAGAIAGLAVSSGIIEGRARVILQMEDAEIEEGDILVTAFTDPGWTPLFVTIKGLVTEVGGLMTHGAVIAREYGLPAVVGVENATKLIKNGQRIRVNGTDGYVEIC